MSSVIRRWGPSVVVLAMGVVVVLFTARTAPVAAAIAGAVLLGGAVAISPWLFPRALTAAAAHRSSAADGSPVVYWRPGCQYCLRLRLRLGTTAGRLHWVDIWKDPAAAAELRGHTGGDETVPTVLVDGRAHVNPDPAWVRRLVRPV